MIPLPGHIPGRIGIVVDSGDGPYIIAGDAVPTYANLEGAPKSGFLI